MKKPVVVVNFKTHKSGKDALKLAKAIEKFDKDIIVGVSPCDVYLISNKSKLKVYCQHVDYFSPGKNTGFVVAEAVKASGASGVFLNHSEHKLSYYVLERTILRCKEAGLKTMVFAADLDEVMKIKKLMPDCIIIEPPFLIAGDVSISSAKPELISEVARNLKRDFLVGAGIKTSDDVRKALELGASGVAVCSAIAAAENPSKALKEMLGR